MSALFRSAGFATLCIALGVLPRSARADKFTYRDADGKTVEVEARLAGSTAEFHALELADGQMRIIPVAAVDKREVSDGPKPLSADTMVAKLQQQFGDERFRSYQQAPFVFGLVLGSPLPKSAESRTANFLRKVATFMKNVETAFVGFVQETRIPAKVPAFPLVILIFETEEDFEKYHNDSTGGRGLSAQNIAGFYSGMTNYLAIRLAECRTFEVPLHEAIHQQVYNRNVFQRLSSVPHWFDEGIATGFEANQGKISIGPTKVSPRYAQLEKTSRVLSWEEVHTDDRVFSGDILAGEAYGHAWSLHWLLVTKYKAQYGKYVRLLAEKTPLQKDTPRERNADFREAFGKSVSDMEGEFNNALDAALKRQKVALVQPKPVGYALTNEGMAEVELTAVRRLDPAGQLEVQGKLTNTSPLRALAFHVTVETNAGTYVEWLIPDLDVGKSSPLPVQSTFKLMRGGRGGPGSGFNVRVRSVPSDSEEAAQWKKGRLPVPVFGG